eukprot:2537791-Amphidinium_carterae.1
MVGGELGPQAWSSRVQWGNVSFSCASSFTVFRLLRLVRIVRLVRVLRMFRDLVPTRSAGMGNCARE